MAIVLALPMVLLLVYGYAQSNRRLQSSLPYEGVLVERKVALPWLPSASGMAQLGPNHWLVVGDDAPAFYVLDSLGALKSQHLLRNQQMVDELGRVPKGLKRDYEAVAAWGPWDQRQFAVFGSGSKFSGRTFISLGTWADNQLVWQEYQAKEFYQQLILQGEILPANLNIEGATVMNERLILLNREDNSIFDLDLTEFIQFIQGQVDKVDIHMGQLSLTSFAGVASGLSGACTDPSGNRLYFSASFEDNSGALTDGQILGSSIGWADLGDTNAHAKIETYHLIDTQGNRLFDKLEAVEVLSCNALGMRLIGITDSDDGGSAWLQIFVPSRFLPSAPALPFGRKP